MAPKVLLHFAKSVHVVSFGEDFLISSFVFKDVMIILYVLMIWTLSALSGEAEIAKLNGSKITKSKKLMAMKKSNWFYTMWFINEQRTSKNLVDTNPDTNAWPTHTLIYSTSWTQFLVIPSNLSDRHKKYT